MPTYRVTAPDGRSFRLKGGAPPTEDQLREIYAKFSPPETPTMRAAGEGDDFGGDWPSSADEAKAILARGGENVENTWGKLLKGAMFASTPLGFGSGAALTDAAPAAAPMVSRALVAANASKIAAEAPKVAGAVGAGSAAGRGLASAATNAAIDLAVDAVPFGRTMGHLAKPLVKTLLRHYAKGAGSAAKVAEAVPEAAPAVEAAMKATAAATEATAPSLATAAAPAAAQAVEDTAPLVMRLQGLAKMPGGQKIINEWLATQPEAVRPLLKKVFAESITRM